MRVVELELELVVEQEQSVFLYTEKNPAKKMGDGRSTEVTVTTGPAGKPALDASSTWGPGGGSGATLSSGSGPAVTGGAVSRGYTEEMEDFAYCVREWDGKLGYEKDDTGAFRQRLPRCHGEVAMADAIIALTANQSMKNRQRIDFSPDWFVWDNQAVPDEKNPPRLPVS